MKIKKTKIIGTNITVFSAWEDCPSIFYGHSTITHEDGQWWGRIGTAMLPDALEKLPAFSNERIDKVSNWHEEEYQRAYSLILESFPEAQGGKKFMGEIEIYD